MGNVIRVLSFFVLFSSLVFQTGCATGISPVSGIIYTDVKGPILATSHANFSDRKVGRSTAKSLFGLIASGDASIHTAAKNGGITKIHHVDYQTKTVLGVVSEVTVIVYGE